MADEGLSSYDQLLGYFVSRVDSFIDKELGATPVHWEEVFSAGVKGGFALDQSTIYQVWTSQSKIQAIVAAEYQVIASPSDVWYLE